MEGGGVALRPPSRIRDYVRASVAGSGAAKVRTLNRRAILLHLQERAWLLLVAALAGFAAFMLLRPLAGGGYYRPRPLSTSYAYGWVVVGLFVPYGIALWAARQGHRPSLPRLLTATALITVPLVVAPLMQSQDLYQYLFYARMQVLHGANPYTVKPRVFSSDPWFPFVNWGGQVSVYGPAWSLAVAGVVAVTGRSLTRSLLVAKALIVAVEGLTVWGLIRLGRDHVLGGDLSFAVMAFALNPLIVSTLALSGHADAAVAAALVWAVVADRRGRPLPCTVLLAVATLVKAYAGAALLVFLVARWRKEGAGAALRSAAVAIGVAVVAFAPYWAGLSTFRGLYSIAGQTSRSLAGAAIRALTPVVALVLRHDAAQVANGFIRGVGVAVLVVTLAALIRSRHTSADPWQAAVTLTAVYFLVTPWFLPWHVVGLVALVCALPESSLTAPILTFSGSCMAFVGGPAVVGSVATAAVRYGPPLYVWKRRPFPRSAERTDSHPPLMRTRPQ